jgi:periplasmic divalent cation tolerance protein
LPVPAILVLTQMPDRAGAETLARALVERRLAACATVGAAVDSMYHWRGKIETANEVPLVVKTTASRYAAVEAAIREAHPYELPEIVAVPIERGLTGYLAWIAAETTPEPSP